MEDIFLWVAAGGLLAGVLHTILGPDHLAAVAVFAADSEDASGWTGLTWGLGHTAGALVIGLVAMALRELFAASLLSAVAESLAGCVLVAIGLAGLYSSFNRRTHNHAHAHDGKWHSHHHIHSGAEAPLENHDPETHSGLHHGHHTHAALGAGALSGLAGGSHILGVSPALAMPTAALSAVYLAFFAFGSVVSMTLFSMMAGALARKLDSWRFSAALSSLAVVVGVVWIVTSF